MCEHVDPGVERGAYRRGAERVRRDLEAPCVRGADDGIQCCRVEDRTLARLDRDLDHRGAAIGEHRDRLARVGGRRDLEAVPVRAPRARRVSAGRRDERSGGLEAERRMIGERVGEWLAEIEHRRDTAAEHRASGRERQVDVCVDEAREQRPAGTGLRRNPDDGCALDRRHAAAGDEHPAFSVEEALAVEHPNPFEHQIRGRSHLDDAGHRGHSRR